MFILPYFTHPADAEPCTDFKKTKHQKTIFMQKYNSLKTMLTFCLEFRKLHVKFTKKVFFFCQF
jgi:hypothetical protein